MFESEEEWPIGMEPMQPQDYEDAARELAETDEPEPEPQPPTKRIRKYPCRFDSEHGPFLFIENRDAHEKHCYIRYSLEIADLERPK